MKNSKSTSLRQLPNGDWYFVRRNGFTTAESYSWQTGFGVTPRDARNRALGRGSCRHPAPPIRPNTPQFRRKADGTFPTV